MDISLVIFLVAAAIIVFLMAVAGYQGYKQGKADQLEADIGLADSVASQFYDEFRAEGEETLADTANDLQIMIW